MEDNPEVKFYFISVWNNGQNGRALLAKCEISAAARNASPFSLIPVHALAPVVSSSLPGPYR